MFNKNKKPADIMKETPIQRQHIRLVPLPNVINREKEYEVEEV